MAGWPQNEIVKNRLRAEWSHKRPEGGALRVALGYPAPYPLAMASLGYSAILKAAEAVPGAYCDRFFLPDQTLPGRGDGTGGLLLGYDTGRPIGDANLLAISVAWELELTGLAQILAMAGLNPSASERHRDDPPVILGGPLTFADPRPLYPFADVVVVGEGEALMSSLTELAVAYPAKRDFTEQVSARNMQGVVLPAHHLADDEVPERAEVVKHPCQPASSAIVSPESRFPGMFLVEVNRGCARGCAYCVMGKRRPSGVLNHSSQSVLQSIPAEFNRVGLVGAAVTDSPHLEAILASLRERQCQVSLSSMRPDRLSPSLLDALVDCDLKTVTTALDGASDRLRKAINRRTSEEDLITCAMLAGERNLRLKIYMMLGLPDEQDADIDELAELCLNLSKSARVTLAVSPFVPKPGTPLSSSHFAPINVFKTRLRHLRKRISNRVNVRDTSPKWAWVEAAISKGGIGAGMAAISAWEQGGSFHAWKAALKSHQVADPCG